MTRSASAGMRLRMCVSVCVSTIDVHTSHDKEGQMGPRSPHTTGGYCKLPRSTRPTKAAQDRKMPHPQ